MTGKTTARCYICECSNKRCSESVWITPKEYEHAIRDGGRVIARGHQTDGWRIVGTCGEEGVVVQKLRKPRPKKKPVQRAVRPKPAPLPFRFTELHEEWLIQRDPEWIVETGLALDGWLEEAA